MTTIAREPINISDLPDEVKGRIIMAAIPVAQAYQDVFISPHDGCINAEASLEQLSREVEALLI